MDENKIICKHCGASCADTQIFCHSCNQSLNEIRSSETSCTAVDGSISAEINLMIDRNAARYLDIFRKNRNRPFFLHFNLAAAFLGIYWFFARKMFLYGILSCLLGNLLGVAAGMVTVKIYQQELLDHSNATVAFEKEYGAKPDNEFLSNGMTGMETYPPEAYDRYYSLQWDQRMLTANLIVGISVGMVLAGVVNGLLADWLYRRYLTIRGKKTGGGFYFGLVFAAMPVAAVINTVIGSILSPILFSFVALL